MDSGPKNFFVTQGNVGGGQHRGGVAYHIALARVPGWVARFRDRASPAPQGAKQVQRRSPGIEKILLAAFKHQDFHSRDRPSGCRWEPGKQIGQDMTWRRADGLSTSCLPAPMRTANSLSYWSSARLEIRKENIRTPSVRPWG